MSEYIIWESDKTETTDYLGVKHGVNHFEKREEIVRCKDCKFRCFDECTRIDEGFKDYWFAIELDGFCAWAKRKEVD